MAKKTLESKSKRKAAEDVKKVAEPTGDEVLSSIATKKREIEHTGSNKKAKTSKIAEGSRRKVADSNKKAKTSKKTEDSSRKVADSSKKAKASKKTEDSKKTDKKVRFESPVKGSGKKDNVEVTKVKKNKVKKEEAVEENGNGADYAFPINRVTRIVKRENPDVKLSAEAAFLFNKASEKFLELFSKEAYACASKDGKKKIEYQHLSFLIPGNTRFDFLADFVPAKVKVADALKEIPSLQT